MFCRLREECADEEALKEALSEHVDELVPKHITVEDILASINYLNGLASGIGDTDDIDHLGNRRLRSVGELLQNQFRIGFSRMERVIRERMTIQDLDIVTPQSLINIRPVTTAIKEFFGSSPLSQFMDQTNPLAELTHKRRMSALGPGGLSRERANFEVRDVHYSHYGRMCPIETPEGPNIGLISYLASYARVNEYGFIEAPYRRIDKATGKLTNDVLYMTADIEDEYIVAQAIEPLDEEGRLLNPRVTCRYRNEIIEVDRDRVDYMDCSARMMVSVATAMIPFLEHDEATRALMGSNMQSRPCRCSCRRRRLSAPAWSIRPPWTPATSCSRRATAWSKRQRPSDRYSVRGPRRGDLRPHQVPALQPGHLRQPASDRLSRHEGEKGRRDRRRPVHTGGARSRSAATCSSRS